MTQEININNKSNSWTVSHQGKEFNWDIPTGPYRYYEKDLNIFAKDQLGINNPEEIELVANALLKPYIKDEGNPNYSPPRIIMHSATDGIDSYGTDFKQLSTGQTPYGFDTFFNQRSISLASPGDMIIGRTDIWRESSHHREDLEILDLESEELYQTSHALLHLAENNPTKLMPLINKIAETPDTMINLYTLDKDIQVFLIWLHKEVNNRRDELGYEQINALNLEANGPEVTKNWNQKGILHPSVEDALEIPNELISNISPHKLLELEGEKSQIGESLEVNIPRMPGYRIDFSNDKNQFTDRFLLAANMMNERYGTERGVTKLVRSTDGTNIITNIDLTDSAKIREIAEEAHSKGDDYIFEAHVDYVKFNGLTTGEEIELVPSSHIIEGKASNMVTLQFTREGEWRGNISINLNEETPNFSKSELMGLTPEMISKITSSINDFANASVEKEIGLSVGGFDFAVGKLGGVFGDEVMVAPQDPNLRFFGAMFMYKFLEKAQNEFETEDIQVATRLIDPKDSHTFEKLKQLSEDMSENGKLYDLIAVVPPRFGMIAASGKTPKEAAENVLAFEEIIKNI